MERFFRKKTLEEQQIDKAKKNIRNITNKAKRERFQKDARFLEANILRYPILTTNIVRTSSSEILQDTTLGTVLVSGINDDTTSFHFTVRRSNEPSSSTQQTVVVHETALLTQQEESWDSFQITVGQDVDCQGVSPIVAAHIFGKLFSTYPHVSIFTHYVDSLMAAVKQSNRNEGLIHFDKLNLGNPKTS